MKNELIELLGIKPGAKASDADIESSILAAVKTLVSNAAAQSAALDQEAVLSKMIRESHGGLNRASALQVLKNRADYAKANPPKKPQSKPKK